MVSKKVEWAAAAITGLNDFDTFINMYFNYDAPSNFNPKPEFFKLLVNLTNLRISESVSQAEMARRLKKNQSWVSRFESGSKFSSNNYYGIARLYKNCIIYLNALGHKPQRLKVVSISNEASNIDSIIEKFKSSLEGIELMDYQIEVMKTFLLSLENREPWLKR